MAKREPLDVWRWLVHCWDYSNCSGCGRRNIRLIDTGAWWKPWTWFQKRRPYAYCSGCMPELWEPKRTKR